MKLLWLTDTHLNMVSQQQLLMLCQQVEQQASDGLLLSGDIADGLTIKQSLETLAQYIGCPIYFVLGNHDYYHNSIHQLRQDVVAWLGDWPHLYYLTAMAQQQQWLALTPTVALIGHDGWADGQSGDFFQSQVQLNDYRLIKELSDISQQLRYQRLAQLGLESAQQLQLILVDALASVEQVILLTHVPPFAEAAWHLGFQADQDYAPHFVNHRLGLMLVEVMQQQPTKQLTVYCGHCHSAGFCQVLPNLLVVTGKAEYQQPSLQAPIYLMD